MPAPLRLPERTTLPPGQATRVPPPASRPTAVTRDPEHPVVVVVDGDNVGGRSKPPLRLLTMESGLKISTEAALAAVAAGSSLDLFTDGQRETQRQIAKQQSDFSLQSDRHLLHADGWKPVAKTFAPFEPNYGAMDLDTFVRQMDARSYTMETDLLSRLDVGPSEMRFLSAGANDALASKVIRSVLAGQAAVGGEAFDQAVLRLGGLTVIEQLLRKYSINQRQFLHLHNSPLVYKHLAPQIMAKTRAHVEDSGYAHLLTSSHRTGLAAPDGPSPAAPTSDGTSAASCGYEGLRKDAKPCGNCGHVGETQMGHADGKPCTGLYDAYGYSLDAISDPYRGRAYDVHARRAVLHPELPHHQHGVVFLLAKGNKAKSFRPVISCPARFRTATDKVAYVNAVSRFLTETGLLTICTLLDVPAPARPRNHDGPSREPSLQGHSNQPRESFSNFSNGVRQSYGGWAPRPPQYYPQQRDRERFREKLPGGADRFREVKGNGDREARGNGYQDRHFRQPYDRNRDRGPPSRSEGQNQARVPPS